MGKKIDISCGSNVTVRGDVVDVKDGILYLRDEHERVAYVGIDKIAIVWDAIALHTTLGVPQRKGPEIALVQLSAGIDVGAAPRELIGTEAVNAILAEWPRLGFKVAFLEAMARIARQKPATGAVNLMGEVGRHQKGLPIPDFCQIVHNSHFTE